MDNISVPQDKRDDVNVDSQQTTSKNNLLTALDSP